VFSPEKQLDKTTEGLSFKERVNNDKKIVSDNFATQTLAVKLSNKQDVQGLTQKTEQILTNNVLPDKKNQADSNQVSSPPTQQAESDIIDDALGLRLANMAKNSQGEAVTTDQKNTNPIKSQSKTSQPENLTKGLALKNKIITENSFYDVNALEPNDKNTEKEFSVSNHTVIRSENLSQKIIKNSAEQSQKTVTDEEHLKENSEESTSSEIDNILSNVEKPKLARPVNVFSDNASSRLAQELQFQTGQTTHNKQSNEAYMAHQASEALNHNIASDTAHIQKNNVQLQQETIAIFRKDFADAVKDKVLVMINQKLQKFEITLDPPEFGNMQVRVNLQGEQASVNFVVQNQQAKEAIEQNMQKLKDMLSEQGVDVGGANVEQQNQREQNDQRNNFASGELINDKLMSEAETQQVFSANIYDISETAIDYYA
jgi:flagellar hook-length control protein FliK